MRIAVEIDTAGDEGSLCIEYTSDRPVGLPESPDPALGVTFVRRSATGS